MHVPVPPHPAPPPPAPPPPELRTAEEIARRAHLGQIEESTGDDYIHHIERVVNLVTGYEAKAVAWLHDVIEDTPLTAMDLRAAGISVRIVDAVVRLTRDEATTSYFDYVQQLKNSGDQLAIAVKTADLIDHLRPNCPERLRPRYQMACETLGITIPERLKT